MLRLTLDRPDKRNALDDEMMAALIEVIDAAGRDEAVRVIVLAGSGDHFCAGSDIVARNARSRRPEAPGRQHPAPAAVAGPPAHPAGDTRSRRRWCARPGLGGGHRAASRLAADFTVAADDARFWEPFAERGFTPDSGATWLLPRRIGEVRAREMLLLGSGARRRRGRRSGA